MPEILGWLEPEPNTTLFVADRAYTKLGHWIDLARQEAACFGAECRLCERYPQKLTIILPVSYKLNGPIYLLRIPAKLKSSPALLVIQAAGLLAPGIQIQITGWDSSPRISITHKAHADAQRQCCARYIDVIGSKLYHQLVGAQ